MINGWLYRGTPSCTMDMLEKHLFGRDYVQLFDLMTVQDDATREMLIDRGADPQRVFVTGNIKFDAASPAARIPEQSRSPVMLKNITDGARPVVTAGCVTNITEQA